MMKTAKLLSYISLLGAAQVFAANTKMKCRDSDGGLQAKQYGRVTYEVVSELCLNKQGEKGSVCTSASQSDADYCKDEKILMEQYCDSAGRPQEKEISCVCVKGKCQ